MGLTLSLTLSQGFNILTGLTTMCGGYILHTCTKNTTDSDKYVPLSLLFGLTGTAFVLMGAIPDPNKITLF